MRLVGASKTIPNQPLTLASAALQHAGRQFLQERYATLFKRDFVPMPDDNVGQAVVTQYEVMRRVALEKPRGPRPPPMGFVDVEAIVRRVGTMHLSERAVLSDDTYRPDDEVTARRWLGSLKSPQELEWVTFQETIRMWFTVRTGAFTLGAILQELKTLAALEARDQSVAVCVDRLDDTMIERINHEGFFVVCMDEYS